jgi:CHAT domain-containing protein
VSLNVVLAAAAYVPGMAPLLDAEREIRELDTLFHQDPELQTTVVGEEADRDRFEALLADANLAHFAGHGRYSANRPDQSGLLFRQGPLTPTRLKIRANAEPIIFGNACESRVVAARAADAAGAWSGLAASFLVMGARNYLGSLWPELDENSRRLALGFYKGLWLG